MGELLDVKCSSEHFINSPQGSHLFWLCEEEMHVCISASPQPGCLEEAFNAHSIAPRHPSQGCYEEQMQEHGFWPHVYHVKGKQHT